MRPPSPRVLRAANAGAFTLDGTQTFLIGTRRVAVVDPGPDSEDHLDAIRGAVEGAESVTVLLTHGHEDHAGGARRLAESLGAPLLGAGPVDRALAHAEAVETDAGALTAVSTPGHAREHLCFHWPEGSAAFVGDLLLGRGDTTWVGGYPGCVADYLRSLERVRGLSARTLFPAHGPPMEPAADAIDRFRHHRDLRIRQVRDALAAAPGADVEELVGRIYPDVPPGLRPAAVASVRAVLVHLGHDPGPGGWYEQG